MKSKGMVLPFLKPKEGTTNVSRRNFLGIAGGTLAGAALLTVGCDENDLPNDGSIDLGSGDFGILNYAYALEQLEAAFYIQVVNSFYAGASDLEKAYLTDIRDHEVAHREFSKTHWVRTQFRAWK